MRTTFGSTSAALAGAVIAVVELDAFAEPAQRAARRLAFDLGEVLLLDAEARMGQPVREIAVVGEQQQSLGVLVEAPDREDPRLEGHEVRDAATTVRIAGRRHHAGGLVQQEVHEAGSRADRARRRLRCDPTAGSTLSPSVATRPLTRDDAVFDQLLAVTPAADAGLRENLLQPFTRHRATSGRRPCSSASTTSASGDELAQRRQVVERVEAEPFEEQARRAVQQREPGTGIARDLLDQAALLQRAHHAVDVHAANGGHLRTAHRLLVRDDRERLERGRRQSRRLTFEHEALDVRREIGMALEPVAAGDADEHEPALVRLRTRPAARRTAPRLASPALRAVGRGGAARPDPRRP